MANPENVNTNNSRPGSIVRCSGFCINKNIFMKLDMKNTKATISRSDKNIFLEVDIIVFKVI